MMLLRVLGLIAVPLVITTPVSAADRPNIILMMADDLGWGDVGFNGNRVIKTPHLDAMAKSGLVCERFYAASAVCSPTRGSVLTGRHPERYGIFTANSGHLPAREICLAEALGDLGYRTGHFGKWHLGTLTKTEKDANRGGPRGAKHFSPPQRNGFDVCFSTESKVPTHDPLVKPPKARRTWWDPVAPGNAVPYGTSYWNERGERVTENTAGDDSRVIMDRAVPFIRDAVKRELPFFSVIWFHSPHLPVVAGEEFTDPYADHDSYARHYFGCVTAMDRQIGRLRTELRELGIQRNTLVAFCSDNGPEGSSRVKPDGSANKNGAPGTAGPFRGRKRDLWEGGVRVPAVVEWPGRIPAGVRTDTAMITSDYLPTIFGLLDHSLPTDREFDGENLWPIWTTGTGERSTPIGFHFGRQSTWMRGDRKLVVRDNRKKSAPLLFDLATDPGETTDIAANHPEEVNRLLGELTAWEQRCREDRETPLTP